MYGKFVYKSILVVEKCFEISESEETENLLEWVLVFEFDKVFFVVVKEILDIIKE